MKRFLSRTAFRTATAAGALLLLGAVVPAPAAHGAAPPVDCAALQGTAVPAAAIGLPTGGGEVTGARQVTGGGPVGPYCRVEVAVHPVDPAAPDITVRIGLPDGWNRKAVMFGGGGYDGAVPDVAGNVPFGPAGAAATPLARGYATFASDSGHRSSAPDPSLDGSFARNDEALRNFAGDALKKTRDAALYVIGERYGQGPPARSYFAGGSTGGREALAVAQRWPRDFDGVLSAYPAWNAASLDLFFGYEAQVLARPGAFLDQGEQRLLYDRVLAACDGDDGLRDGVIADEAGCRFDPRALRCRGGADHGDTCLSDRQIRAVRALSSRFTWPYRLASGETSYPGFPFLSGADMTTPRLGMGTAAPADPMPESSGYGVRFWDQWVKHFVTRDPEHGALAVDPRRPGPWRDRISELSALQDVNDPDLRPFAAAGGRLLLLHGTADELVSHRSTVEYAERVRDVMGKRAADAFARFYLVPGANHANVDAAFTAGWDSLGALDAWVERGAAPAHPVVTDNGPAGRGRTRPLCAYPAWPRYTGGDPGRAGSFRCVR
ncbi:tannase/feruloyl esterase family alpha/beta hydrolase [Streptomyces sp. NPDC000151]|uniref:tannase/feruloyl esterase family alpha/beta hydrolase n=1 Tax=Streptomyces sp. NPDC000151 TaxID=3154244 RepID=UPI00332CC981